MNYIKNFICIIAIILVSQFTQIESHAKLNTPTAWNSSPSKTSPCGGGSPPSSPSASWSPGATENLVWQVVAGDGNGVVSASIDTAGGTNFKVNLPLTGPFPVSGTGIYPLTAAVPANVNCASCTIQFQSTSGWFACTTIRIGTGGGVANSSSTGTSTNSTCVTASGLNFCNMVNGKLVKAPPTGFSLAQIDNSAIQTVSFDLNHPVVFASPSTPGCKSAYTAFICALNFPLCYYGKVPTNNDEVCVSTCNFVYNTCNITADEASIMNCIQYDHADLDSSGNCCGSSCSLTFNAASDARITLVNVTGPSSTSGSGGNSNLAVRAAVRDGFVAIMSLLGILMSLSSFMATLF